jgi:Domain of unknown function (DUF4340)
VVSWRAGLVLLVVLIAVIVYAVVSRPRPPTPSASFLPCTILNTVEVRLEGQGRVVELERPTTQDTWQVTRPLQAPADSTRATTLVSTIETLSVLNTIASPEPAATYGLDHPHAVVTCRLSNRRSYNLSVGNQSFDSSGYYAQKSGDRRVYVISGVGVDVLDRTLADPPVKPSPSPTT